MTLIRLSLDPITEEVEVVDIVGSGAAVGFIDGSVVVVDSSVCVGAAVGLIDDGSVVGVVGSEVVGSAVGLQVGSGQIYGEISIGALNKCIKTDLELRELSKYIKWQAHLVSIKAVLISASAYIFCPV